ncbi:CHAT domain containing protein [Actinobacteria bacterium OK074]|nr:CHAT domain containing protein [Actinobacteria bacterium OK074]
MDVDRVRRLLDEQRYADVADAVGASARRRDGDAAAWTLLLRCRLEQGLVEDARVLAEAARGRFAEASAAGLWCRFAVVFAGASSLTPRELDAFVDHCALVAADAAPAVAALAADLRAQGLALRFTLSGQSPGRRAAVADAWVAAADGYRRADLPGDADRTVRRAASFLRQRPGADPPRARDLLRAALADAERRDDALSAAESAFALAEADLEAWFAREFGTPGGGPHEQFVAALESAADRLAEAGASLAEPRAYAALARLCLEHGVSDGVELAQKAAAGFRQADVPGQELPLWQSLALWHVHHGDAAARAHAEREATPLGDRVGHPLAADARAVSAADTAFRGGDRGLADALTDAEGPYGGQEFAGRAVVRASVLSAMGLADEALGVLREVDRKLRDPAAPAGLLPEVSLSLASLLAESDPGAAHAHLEHGAAVARDLGLPVDRARCLAMGAWVSVLARRRGGTATETEPQSTGTDTAAGTTGTPGPHDPAALFDEAIALLEPLTTLDARTHLVSVLQQRGQAAFFTADWDECAASLSRAEEVARAYGLGPQLAFTLSYQALVLIDRARHGAGAATYDEADRRLAEVQTLLATAGLRPEIWRTLFHRALCALEHGDRYAPDVRDRARHYARADTLLTRAAAEIDRLRAASATAGAAAVRAQHARIALAGDKSEVYRTGFELHWHRRADAAQALRWLERAKSRALLDGLAELAPRMSPELAREQELAAREAPTDAEELALRDELDALLASMREGPMAGYARARTAEPPDSRALREALEAEERHAAGRRVLIAEYRCTERETLLFGLRADWPLPRVATVPLDHARLVRYAAQYFRRPGGVRLMMEDLADGGARDWHAFATLVAPLADWSAPGDLVYLVPHGTLHDLPLHTLPVDGEPLLLRNPVGYSPSSAVLLDLLNRPGRGAPARAGGRAVFGDPRGNLPRAAREAATVAGLLAVEPSTGAEVTAGHVLDALEHRALVHLAGHGRLSTGDGFERGMELADGVLRASDLLGRRIGAATVLLSGCETGVHEQRAGDEPVGLSRALFLGGGRTVVVSQWKVADASAETLLAEFHRELAQGVSCADALHHAARTVAGPPGRRRHFYHWGAFVAMGDWR